MGTLQYKIISHNIVILTQSMAEKLKTGALNMLLGVGTVFLVLIIIILILNLFKFVPYWQEKMSGKAKETSNTVDHVLAQIVEQEEEELNEDFELIAVITAAIYASLGDNVPTDGLIVRSIRKVNSKRRMNA